MNIEHAVTITQYSAAFKAHIERTIWLHRPRRLTLAGAERIIRREHPCAVAIRVEHFVRA